MATNSDVIDRALRKINVVPLGQTTPAGDQANALVVLQALYGEWYGMGVFGRGVAMPSTNLTDPPALGMAYFDGVACALAVRLWTDYSGDKAPNPSVQDGADKLTVALQMGQGEQGGAVSTVARTVADVAYAAARRLIGIRANVLSIFQQQAANDAAISMFREWRDLGYLGRNAADPPTTPTDPCPVGESYADGAAAVLAYRIAPDFGVQQVSPAVDMLAKLTLEELGRGAFEQIGAVSTAARTVGDIAYGAARRLIGLSANALNLYQQQALNDAAVSMFAEWRDRGYYGRSSAPVAVTLAAPCPVGETYADGATAVLATRLASTLAVDAVPQDVEALAKATLDQLSQGQFEQAGQPTTATKTVSDVMYAAARRLIGPRANVLNLYQQQVLTDAARAMFLDWGNRGYYGRNAPPPNVDAGDPCPVGDAYFDGAAAALALRVANDFGVEKPSDATAALAGETVKQLAEGQVQTGAPTNGVKTVADLIYAAARKLVQVQAGSLTPYQLQVGLDALQGLYMELVGRGVFGRLYDFIATSYVTDDGVRYALSAVVDEGARNPAVPVPNEVRGDLVALEQMRVCCADDDVIVVLPTSMPTWWCEGGPSLYPYATSWSATAWWGFDPLTSPSRPPRDGSCIEVILPSDTTTYVYDAQVQAWVAVSALALSDAAPLARRYYEALSNALALRMADGMDAKPSPLIERGASLMALSHRLDSIERPLAGQFF